MADEPVADGGLPPERGDQGPPIVAPELDGLDGWVFISRGGHGEVWAATERSLGRRVAVKILPRLISAEARHRFRVESSAIGSLTGHPSILSVLRSDITADGHGVIVMEYAERSLADQLASEGPLPPDQVVSIITRVAAGLDAAHASGVLHLDVKPANVLVSAFGEPKLADFGVAAIASPPMDATIDNPAEWVAGMTPGYGPPELLEGAEPSVSTDVHLLAATAVALLSGSPPYARDGDSPVDVWRRTLTTEPDLVELGVPDDMIPALAAGLARDPSQRPSSAGEFAQLLSGEITATDADSASSEDRPTDPRTDRSTRRRLTVFGTAAAALLVLGVVLLATRNGGNESDVAAGGPAPEAGSDLWVDAGTWSGIALIDMERQELLSLVPGQEISRPVVGTNGTWALDVEDFDDGPPSVSTLDPTTGSTLDRFEFPDQDARSSCQLVTGEDVWVTCTSDATSIRGDPVERVSNPSVTLYRLTADGPEPVLTRDGKLDLGSAHKSTVWLVIDESEQPTEAMAPPLVVRVDGDSESSVRLPAGSPGPAQVLATTDGLWLVDGRAANVVDVDGPELVASKPQVWNFSPFDAFRLSEPVEYDGGIAFLAEMGEEPFLVAVHLRVGTDPVTAEVPFRYEFSGLEPVLAITDSGRWWTLGEPQRAEGTVTPSEEFTLVGIDFPAATIADEISFPSRSGPLADPGLQAVGDDLLVLAELPESDISAVIVDGDTGQTRATIPLQQRSLLPLVGPDDQVVVADLWTSTVWIVDGAAATQEDGPNIPDPPVAVPNGFATTSRQRGGGGLYSWDGEERNSITVDGELFTDGTALWYENSDAAGVIDTSTGRATPVTTGSEFSFFASGTRMLIRNAAVIDGDFWRIRRPTVTRTRPDGTVTSVVIPSPSGEIPSSREWAIARSPSGSVAAVVDGVLHLIDPATEQIIATTTVIEAARTGYLVSDDTSLWWVALHDGSALQLDPATGDVVQRVDDLGRGIATAAVSSGALVVAHESSGTLTRVGGDGGRVTREVGPRPYGVSANDDLVVVGLQGERAVAEFDSAALTERRRVPLGPRGPDS